MSDDYNKELILIENDVVLSKLKEIPVTEFHNMIIKIVTSVITFDVLKKAYVDTCESFLTIIPIDGEFIKDIFLIQNNGTFLIFKKCIEEYKHIFIENSYDWHMDSHSYIENIVDSINFDVLFALDIIELMNVQTEASEVYQMLSA